MPEEIGGTGKRVEWTAELTDALAHSNERQKETKTISP
jgi:hypothetical protein